MDVPENDYCRLCADLKQCSDLINMKIKVEKRQDIINKLARFNITVNFDNELPKTVCFVCVKSLECAYDFVTTIDLAQEAFADYTTPDIKKDEALDTIKKVEMDSEDETMVYATFDRCDEENNINIKSEPSTAVWEELGIEYNPVIIKVESNVKDSEFSIKKSESTNESCESQLGTSINNKSNSGSRRKPETLEDFELLKSWDEYNWLCAYCDRYYQTSSELKIHGMQYHSTCNPYRCFDCRARALHIDNFVTHLCQHKPFLTLTCYICSLKCNSLEEMKEHRATHIDSDYVCKGCNTTFSSQHRLNKHTLMYYKDAGANSLLAMSENKSLTCVICQKVLNSRLALNRHLSLHTDRKRDHICVVCGKGFYQKKELVQHEVIHSDARPYECEFCHFAFKLKADLKKHVALHFGQKTFGCDQCGKKFRLKQELITHSKVHTDSRPYMCTYCNKTFRLKHLLTQHTRVHTGAKPYPCNMCPLMFRNWSNFSKHTKETHGVDNAKRTSYGLYATDPATKKVIYPETEKVLKWKDKLLVEVKKGRPRKIVEKSGTAVKRKRNKKELDMDMECDG